MEYQEAKEKFISTWGSLGSLWGINKAMAQIQALLLISTTPLSMEDIMEDLKISRGNTSMNLRQLSGAIPFSFLFLMSTLNIQFIPLCYLLNLV